MWSSVLSGLFSGIIGVLGAVYTITKTDERQEVSLKVQATNDLIYRNQIEWYGKLRVSIAELISQFIHINMIIEKLNYVEKETEKIRLNGNNRQEMRNAIDELDGIEREVKDSLIKIQTQLTLVNLYLFENSKEENYIRNKLSELIDTYYNPKSFKPIPEFELNLLVEKVRELLKHQQTQLIDKISK
ncbi:hypothetical protein [Limosilactobacillus reuteri]|uniref:hypothetical protein n=1 Tax=Limosilactobacillus reuteri TaxID=1598 RepID=UPI0021A3307A|nr:hypothetical protein [Limosilactobacillus reuteri]MCT3188569.1 hypothetical protein [Limosilactobacillus reuteri]MCT3196313.1 hypothetical protein [Limosilactobacillus reuteri]